MRSYDYNLFADYFQFYLQDETAEGDSSEAWTDEAFNDFVAVVPGMILIRTVRNMDVPVRLEILESEPSVDVDAWDHITECDIEVKSERLVIAGCTDYFAEAARIEVEPGHYRARIYYGDLDALSEDGLDGDDHYRIALWKSEPKGVRVVKRWEGEGD